MRVIAGRWRGRRLRSRPLAPLRPTADRVREALFSILGEGILGARVVDLYAGSGALGIEALSRGAETVTWVEREPALVALIRENLASLGVAEPSPAARVVRGDVDRFLRRLEPHPRLVLLADPPYHGGAPGLLRWLAERPGGYAAAVLEHPAKTSPGEDLVPRTRVDRRTYGNVGVTVFLPHPAPGR